ncbi:MAG: hypothetical protein SFY80_02955 [Verrucomicrobiota bacterium]|nr:hypothetical protein [Verrucomicrobiota bacterium]
MDAYSEERSGGVSVGIGVVFAVGLPCGLNPSLYRKINDIIPVTKNNTYNWIIYSSPYQLGSTAELHVHH